MKLRATYNMSWGPHLAPRPDFGHLWFGAIVALTCMYHKLPTVYIENKLFPFIVLVILLSVNDP